MPLLRPSPSDYTAVVKSLAVAGAAVSNPQGSRPPSKGSVAFVNVASTGALIRASPRLVTMPAPKAAVVPVVPRPTLPIDPNNYTVYQSTSFLNSTVFMEGKFTLDTSGNLYGRLQNNSGVNSFKLVKIAPNGTQTFIAGNGVPNNTFIPGLGAAVQFDNGMTKCVFDSSGNLFIAGSSNRRIIKVEPNGNTTTYAGTGTAGFGDGDRTIATFTSIGGITIDASDTVYVAEIGRKTIRKITPDGQVSTLTFSAAFSPSFYTITMDSLGTLYAIDSSLHRVYKITPTGPSTADIALLAGSTSGYTNGQGSAAQFNFVPDNSSICVDRFGNVYVADGFNGSVRKITPSGNVITIAGNGTVGTDSATQLFYPGTPFVDTNGVVYISTSSSVRKLTPVS